MKLPIQSAPVVRYTTSNLTISPESMKDEGQTAISLRGAPGFSSGMSSESSVTASASCIGVGIVNRRVCLKVPVVGNICMPVVNVPFGNVGAQACISVCKKWGIPTGACVSIRVNGNQVARQCFGLC
ncbi:MAG TPA: hypothetical protein VEZ17_05880 [Chitinophagaceae bacterium]|nr:hypothetical protein [Chitinophagaceae bacterium]